MEVFGRGDSGADQEIDVRRVEPCSFDRLAHGADGKHRSVFVRRRFPALLDAGARSDPLVRGFDHLGEIGICQNAFRVRVSGTQNSSALI
jgi:hypothetical protein